ncbi:MULTISPECIES: hypothetical protein [Streptomycetaceae]|uniref:Lipoprotein n=1 Tax=Streptantibioticus cattleyicolor (strain ATCC 35852 / DSM 46488 / JCM 4925 / NBRC 14057 / NRRL 8057) TaxID=1003195 RepID=F8JXL1_STREN|nr:MULTISPECIES: hypothetical protein [Streptomycetaceae]AEW97113.1 lipoprotein [Streptantibioticus cattleyicolor NRRL 8057 = DSM 46488]MYS61572.1 hypothetical protein [Streptomyces sp. SID5468]CCB77437.1 putative lipoprotein [Streptantibioticus cattleyicolor NRRL 8057 = DSM 46488]
MRARTAIVLTGLFAAVAGGCAIPPTGVIEAGQPAVGVQRPGRPKEAVVRLFFLSAAGLTSTPRQAAGVVPPDEAVDLLFAGPSSAELARGLTTDLPLVGSGVKVVARSGQVVVAVPFDVARLSPGAVAQLTCTAANAAAENRLGTADDVKVSVIGGGTTRGPGTCRTPALPTAASVPAPAG